MEQYYVKEGRRYKPIGVFIDREHLFDGVYYVRANGTKRTSVSWHKINEGEILDILKAVDSIELTDIITPLLMEVPSIDESPYERAKRLAKGILNKLSK